VSLALDGVALEGQSESVGAHLTDNSPVEGLILPLISNPPREGLANVVAARMPARGVGGVVFCSDLPAPPGRCLVAGIEAVGRPAPIRTRAGRRSAGDYERTLRVYDTPP